VKKAKRIEKDIFINTAMTMAAPVVTKDEKILNYPYVETIW